MKNKKKALILGGEGLIGSTIAIALTRTNYDVVIVDRKQRVSEKKFTFVATDALKNDTIVHLLTEHQPDLIINCINIATIYSHNQRKGYPRIIQFYSNLYKGLTAIQHPVRYIQVGTTGSGGLGFNIPFTHGERIEDLPIIHKAAFAGITTSMLTLLSRSFNGAHTIVEIKPGLAIFRDDAAKEMFNNSCLVLLNGGESGHYTYNELRMLTSFMGFTTAERISDKILDILEDKQTRKTISQFDIIENLNRTIVMPTESDIVKRDLLLESMRKLSGERYIIATGSLGPPTLTRDLILSYLHLTDQPSDKDGFSSCFSRNQSIFDTLAYIAKYDRRLHRFLKAQCTFENYLALQPYSKNCTEPWEIVTKQFIKTRS